MAVTNSLGMGHFAYDTLLSFQGSSESTVLKKGSLTPSFICLNSFAVISLVGAFKGFGLFTSLTGEISVFTAPQYSFFFDLRIAFSSVFLFLILDFLMQNQMTAMTVATSRIVTMMEAVMMATLKLLPSFVLGEFVFGFGVVVFVVGMVSLGGVWASAVL